MIPKLTTQGISLMVQALDGGGVTFTRIAIGNGDTPADYKSLTRLQNEILSVEIQSIEREDDYVLITAPMLNASYDGGFHWTEMGVYAQNPNGGEDVLYAYSNYELSGELAATYIPSAQSGPVDITHQVYVFVGEMENVSAILSKHSVFADREELEAHTTDNANPHKVTKEQVGLGLVPNAAPGDIVPEFSNAPSSYSEHPTTKKLTFANIFSGETMGNMLQKIRTMIGLFVLHVNGSNPHRLGASDVGAAPKGHTHEASDINSGTLSIGRGGTNATTASKARANLGIQAGQISVEVVAGEPRTHAYKFKNSAFEGSLPVVTLTPMLATPRNLEFGIQHIDGSGFMVCVHSPTYSGDITLNWIACNT